MDESKNCFSPIYEMASESAVNGRRHIKLILHEIHEDASHFQLNGLSWNEEYTRANMSTIAGMSIVAEFVNDDRSMPYGHGFTSIENNIPLFEDATVVGHFEKAYIDDVDLGDGKRRVLIAEGTLDEMRYPKFIQWIQEQRESGAVKGSVEIVGKKENNGQIVYEDGWKQEGRVPMVYDYSGYAILNIPPADEAAVVMELNNGREKRPKEDEKMDEKAVAALKEAVVQAVNETNAKNAEYEGTITELNNKIEQMQEELNGKDATITELNSQLESAQTSLSEKDSKISEINAELEKANNEKAISELNNALEAYTDDQKAVAKDDIEAFKANPGTVEINTIVGKICTEIVKKQLADHGSDHIEIDVFGVVEMNEGKSEEEDPVEVF